MGFWDANDINAARLNRLGPWFDEHVGTDGNYQDLKAALDAGKTRIVLGVGAFLSADVVISTNNGFIWSPYEAGRLNLGAFGIEIQGQNWRLAGFQLNGGSAQIKFNNASAALIALARVSVWNNTAGPGIWLAGAGGGGYVLIDSCESVLNTTDGLLIASGYTNTRVIGGRYTNNGGYGVNDANGASTGALVLGCGLLANSSGRLNGVQEDVGNT